MAIAPGPTARRSSEREPQRPRDLGFQFRTLSAVVFEPTRKKNSFDAFFHDS